MSETLEKYIEDFVETSENNLNNLNNNIKNETLS